MPKRKNLSAAVAAKEPAQLDAQPHSLRQRIARRLTRDGWLYLFLVPTVIWYLVFCYAPMGGIVVAFKRYTGALSIWESKWVGLKWFKSFFDSFYSSIIIRNTIVLSLYSMLTFPLPIILALILNEVKNARFKKTVQTILYAPHFVSVVVLVSMINLFFHPSFGFVNSIIETLGGETHNFIADPDAFRHLYVWSGVWQNLGWDCVIYVAALSAVDPGLHEAATLDGASRFQRIIHINLPTIMPTIVIMLILRAGSIMSVGGDKVLLMLNDLNGETAEVISTYVYNRGLISGDFSYASAVGLFTNVTNMILLLIVNSVSKRVSETSLF